MIPTILALVAMGAYIALRATFVLGRYAYEVYPHLRRPNRAKHVLVSSACFCSALITLYAYEEGPWSEAASFGLSLIGLSLGGVSIICITIMIFTQDNSLNGYCQLLWMASGGFSVYTALAGAASANRSALVIAILSMVAMAVTDLHEAGAWSRLRLRFRASTKYIREE